MFLLFYLIFQGHRQRMSCRYIYCWRCVKWCWVYLRSIYDRLIGLYETGFPLQAGCRRIRHTFVSTILPNNWFVLICARAADES